MTTAGHKVILVFLAAIASFSCNSSKEANNKKPNILILLADQWRAQSVGYAGDSTVKTPHIDSLASVSAKFKYAVSGLPVCTPFKASILTGQRPLTNGVFMNDVRLDTSAVTIAEVLAGQGYHTGLIGKWHLDGQYRQKYTPPGPRRQGFQYWKAINCDHDYTHEAYYFDDDSTRHYWKGFAAVAETKDAQKYIVKHAHDKSPFFLELSWAAPHSPYHLAPRKYKNRYDSVKLVLRPNVPSDIVQKYRRALKGYYANISLLDDMVGSILSTLKEQGIINNTIILFTSDHGDLLGSHGFCCKQLPYDESIRIPMLFYYSGKQSIKKGAYNAMINSEDIMPTLLGLCGVKVPPSVEGIDFSKYLRKKEKDPKDTAALITCIQPFGQWARPDGGKEYRGIRTPRYTYVRDLNGPWLLFDNRNDPYQMDNLVNNAQYADLQKKLNGLLNKKLKVTHDQFLPGPVYVKKFHYPKLSPRGTVPYFFHGKWH